MAMRLRTRRWTSSRTASPGSETSSIARASGRAAAMSCGDCGKTFCSHQRATSGKDSSRSVSPVGAQSTMTQPKRPSSWWRLICSRLKSSSRPGGTVSSSALMRSTPRSSSSSPSQSWTAAQLRSISSCADTCWAHRRSPTCVGSPPTGGLQRVGQRVRGVGREHDGVDPARGDAPRRGSGDRGLADPALARVEDRPGRHGDASAYSARPHRDPPGDGADVARQVDRAQAHRQPAARCAGGRRRRGGRSRSAPSA